ncbi:hypothetical protein BF93_04870 [Brachybacterium phenoliresistens]|uniref:Uncharacterized protein n=1 Tax=Brachybacterium phenoliresistens TaxID=396014 RepID=Z9JPU5_9MICO|nr:hypothetical protein [Brachybacterium phenoliresistens]EWS80214.1 hypothetical protein BF93_04870 [Brachybacterium phenoliresistens]
MRDLDLSALGRGSGARARLRVLAESPLLLMGTTVVVLLVLVPAIVLVVVLASGAPLDGGMLAFLGILLLGGILGLVDVRRRTATSGGVEAFAEANGLDLIRESPARDYGAHRFRTGSRIVRESVRTREARLREIGDAWPMTLPEVGISAATGVRVGGPRTAEVFLRARLSAPVRAPLVHDGREAVTSDGQEDRADGSTPFVSPEMDRDLRAFAGPYTLEISGQEVVLCGSRPLDASRAERVQEAAVLVEALASRTEALLVDDAAGGPHAPVPWAAATGPHHPAPPRRGARRPVVVLLGVLALLVVVPVALAVVMSSIDHVLLGREVLAKAVVGVAVVLILGIVAAVARWMTAGRGAPRR